MKNKRIIISGANGFIGHHLVNRLAEDNTIIPLTQNLLYGSVMRLEAFLIKEKPDYLFHLAAYGNHYFQTEEDRVIVANLFALSNLLQASMNIKYKGFLNFATTYHNEESGSFYGATKAGGEYLVRAFVNKYKKPIVNIRPYSVFGEYEWDFRFLPTISNQIRQGKEITVSDVSHDWIYVEDFIDGLLFVAREAEFYEGVSVGIGTGSRVSNKYLARMLMRAINKTVPIKAGIKREYEIAAYSKVMNSARDENEILIPSFGKTPLEEALRRVYNSPEKYLKRYE